MLLSGETADKRDGFISGVEGVYNRVAYKQDGFVGGGGTFTTEVGQFFHCRKPRNKCSYTKMNDNSCNTARKRA